MGDALFIWALSTKTMIDLLPWLISAGTVLCVALLDRSGHPLLRRLFDWFPAILFAYVIPAVVSRMAQLDFSAHLIHDFSKNYVIPLAILTVMSSLSIRQLQIMGWRPIAVFVVGSLWIALFPVLYVLLFRESALVVDFFAKAEYWKGLPPIVGSWIGGSTSQVVLKELVNCPEPIFLSILIIDNILVNIWTILMFQVIKKTNWIDGQLRLGDAGQFTELKEKPGKTWSPYLVTLLLVLFVLLTNLITHRLIEKIIILSAVGLALGNYLRGWPFRYILQLGGILILAVMAILGLKLRFNDIQIDPTFLGFLVIWLLGHFVFMLLCAKILKLSSVWVPIASMANVGGIATAPAVTSAYNKALMPHAILLAVLSMVSGTFWGMLTIFLLRILLG
ncbi:MAG TPA: DUF819 family protein [Saprospiraceae bacterium]|nr:DUF819 family protein [Saprospiraceae bacterium]